MKNHFSFLLMLLAVLVFAACPAWAQQVQSAGPVYSTGSSGIAGMNVYQKHGTNRQGAYESINGNVAYGVSTSSSSVEGAASFQGGGYASKRGNVAWVYDQAKTSAPGELSQGVNIQSGNWVSNRHFDGGADAAASYGANVNNGNKIAGEAMVFSGKDTAIENGRHEQKAHGSSFSAAIASQSAPGAVKVGVKGGMTITVQKDGAYASGGAGYTGIISGSQAAVAIGETKTVSSAYMKKTGNGWEAVSSTKSAAHVMAASDTAATASGGSGSGADE